MELIYTVILAVLFILSVLGLIVGVSNDAANFLNSAIGSKAAPRKVILLVASVGILLGAIFSNGMMEVARSGVFQPAMFSFHDVMLLFLAVMLTNVILLDLFNTLGLPTSTTVSLVFGLLGAAVAVSLINIGRSDTHALSDLGQYINSGKALAIISGILISGVIAFICGSLIMFITRLLFSFRYHKTFQILGPFWCGLAFTAITYFALFKGMKDSSIVAPEVMGYMMENTGFLLAAAFVAWTALSALLQHLFRINVLVITVLAGTLSLALAFAGNDLVNFIGVFMAGFDSYRYISVTGGDPSTMMTILQQPAVAHTSILITAGLIMTVTLWFSKKAQSVTETEVNLARQDSGAERFGSTSASRAIVRFAINANRNVSRFMPDQLQRIVRTRFRPVVSKEKDAPPFDLIRATVNLTVASLLISSATSLKLPLSTTYVTFMVAMGSSLADKAWGRESAVYRITGVLTVISGWFLTALVAFLVAAVVACILMWAGVFGVGAMILLCGFMLLQNARSYRRSHKRQQDEETIREENRSVIQVCTDEIRNTMKKVVFIYNQTLVGVFNEDRRLLKNMAGESYELYQEAHDRKHQVFTTLQLLRDNDIHTGHYYVQVVDYLDEVTKALLHICRPCYEHINNNHEGLNADQINDLMTINKKVSAIYDRIIEMLETSHFEDLDTILTLREELFDTIAEAIISQIRRTKRGKTSTKNSALYLEIISETKTMVLQSRNLLKSQKYFVSNMEME